MENITKCELTMLGENDYLSYGTILRVVCGFVVRCVVALIVLDKHLNISVNKCLKDIKSLLKGPTTFI